MEISLLFRKRSPLTDDGLPWLSGNERHTWCARRNATGEAGVSAILAQLAPHCRTNAVSKSQ